MTSISGSNPTSPHKIEEDPAYIYGILTANGQNQRFLLDAFFLAHCPILAPTLLKEPEALEEAGLSHGGQLSTLATHIVKDYVLADDDFHMSLAPRPENDAYPISSP